MTEELQIGAGLCRPSALLSIRAVRAVIQLGAVADVVHTALNAAHHANRHGDPDDRVAVALPGLHLRRGVARPGHEVVLFGSEASLARYAALEGIRTLARRGMIAPPEVAEAWAEPGETGTAFVRDRAAARRSPGALRRAYARAARRGAAMPEEIEARAPDPAVLALHYGAAVVHVRALDGAVADEPFRVGTFGFASPSAPAVLPIRLDRAGPWADDAA